MLLTSVLKKMLPEPLRAKLRELRQQQRLRKAPAVKQQVSQKLVRQRLGIADLAKFESGVTIFFAPEAGVVPFFTSHCILARTLRDTGHPVLMVGCFDVFPRCIVMDSLGRSNFTSAERDMVCSDCGTQSLEMIERYGLDSFDIGDMLGTAEQAKIDRLLADLPSDIRDFAVDGIAFGKIASAEASVILKTLDFAGEDPEVRKALLKYLRGALISYFAMQRLMQTVRVSRIVYFCEYAMHLGATLAGRKSDIPISNLAHAHIMAANRQYPTLSPYPIALLGYRDMLKAWSRWRDLALSPAKVNGIFADSFFRFTSDAVMVYSRSRSGATDQLFQRLGLAEDKPVVVAFTSSLDEIYANRLMLDAVEGEPFSTDQPFKDQIDWLNCLINHAEKSASFQLVVRIHPREGNNRREATVSEHLLLLRQNFDKPYTNVRIVWPEDKVSSYDLMEIADVGTSAWSSTAMEMARLGSPAIIAFRDYTPMPIEDVVGWGRTPHDYIGALISALDSEPSFSRVRAATRWMNLRIFGNAIDLRDVVPSPEYNGLPPFQLPASASMIESILVTGEKTMDRNFMALETQQSRASVEAEQAAILVNMRKAAWLLSFGTLPQGDYSLHHGPVAKLPAELDAAAWREGGMTVFMSKSQTVRRRSRMVERLVQLSAQTHA